MKASLSLLLLEVELKYGRKNFQQQSKSIFLGNLYKIFSLWCIFLQELTIHDNESLLQAEKF